MGRGMHRAGGECGDVVHGLVKGPIAALSKTLVQAGGLSWSHHYCLAQLGV